MIDRIHPPSKQPLCSFSLEAPEKFTLPNGINAYYFPNPSLDLLHFTLRIRAGSLFENQKFLATATFSQLIESASGLTPSEIEDFLDYYGAIFQCSVGLEFVTLHFVVPKSTCREVLPFIYSFLATPCFSEENLILFKERKKKELQMNRMKVGYCSGQLMYHTLLNPQLSASEILTEESIEAVTPLLMQYYHSAFFCSENMELFFTGNVDISLKEEIYLLFSSVPSAGKSALPLLFTPKNQRKQWVFEKKEESLQSSILLCKSSLGYQEEERRDFSVLSTLLGGYFGSRLMQNLREKNGYTYGIYCFNIYFDNTSMFYVDSDVNVANTEDAINQCKYEIRKLHDELVLQEELETVKTYMIGNLLRKLDGSVNVMREYVLWSSSGFDEREANKIVHAIQNITPERINDLAKKHLKESDFTTIVVGNTLKNGEDHIIN